MQETQVRSLGGEDPLEEGMATHSGILAWRIPWTQKPSGLQVWSLGSHRVGYSRAINTHSVHVSRSVVSDSWRTHGLQHTRPPCSLPTPRVYSNSSPLSWWCHPTILPSVVPFSSRLQSYPASGSFQMSQFFTSGGQSIGVSFQHQSFQWMVRTDLL